MHSPPILLDLLIVFGAALAVLLLVRLVKLLAVLGFMLTRMLIGPHVPGAVSDAHQVEGVADVGVTTLLFVIGLEFSIARLKEFRRAFFLGGFLQVAVTMIAVYLLLARGAGRGQALLAACLVV